eukprot:3710566-Rhodomonas_salina.1
MDTKVKAKLKAMQLKAIDVSNQVKKRIRRIKRNFHRLFKSGDIGEGWREKALHRLRHPSPSHHRPCRIGNVQGTECAGRGEGRCNCSFAECHILGRRNLNVAPRTGGTWTS